MGYQAFQTFWPRFLFFCVHKQVHLVRGMERLWRTNYNEDKGRGIQAATNHPIRPGFYFPGLFWGLFLWNRRRVWLRSCSWENARPTVSPSPCCSPAGRSHRPGSLPWRLCSQLPGIYLCIPYFPFLFHTACGPRPQPESLSWLPIGSVNASSLFLTQWLEASFNMKLFPETQITSAPVKAFAVWVAGMGESLQIYRRYYNGKLSLLLVISSKNSGLSRRYEWNSITFFLISPPLASTSSCLYSTVE